MIFYPRKLSEDKTHSTKIHFLRSMPRIAFNEEETFCIGGHIKMEGPQVKEGKLRFLQ